MGVYKVKLSWVDPVDSTNGLLHDGKLVFAKSYTDCMRKIEAQMMGENIVAIEEMEALDVDDIIDIDYLKDDIDDLMQYIKVE